MTSREPISGINEVQLERVYLYSLRFRHRDDGDTPADRKVVWHLDVGVAHRQPSPTELRIKLKGELKYEESSHKPFDLAVELVGDYRAENPITEEQIGPLLVTHSQPLLWPYLREIITDITTRAGGPTLVAPTLKITFPTKKRRARKPADQGCDPRQDETPPEAPVPQSTGG